MQFIIRADQPYKGSVLSVMLPDGTVAYTDGLTLEEYADKCAHPIKAISENEWERLDNAFESNLKTKPTEITEERFDEMLSILPPSRWHDVGSYNVFHVCEHIRGNLVNWFARRDGKYWQFIDSCFATDSELASKLNAAREGSS